MLDVPSHPIDELMEDPNKDEDLIPPDERRPMRLLDARRQGDGELSDSDDEGEGGRRDHARHDDRDSVSASRSSENDSATNGGRKFGMGVGIMSSGQTGTTHGAGPSGHTTVPPLTATAATSREGSAMEVDERRSTGGNNEGGAPSPLAAKEMTPDSGANGMAVDPPAES
jgi:histone deacetylase 1/2